MAVSSELKHFLLEEDSGKQNLGKFLKIIGFQKPLFRIIKTLKILERGGSDQPANCHCPHWGRGAFESMLLEGTPP